VGWLISNKRQQANQKYLSNILSLSTVIPLGESRMAASETLLTQKNTGTTNKTSLGKTALIAGLGLLIMAIAAPFAELYVYPQLVIPENAAQTLQNILAHQTLFTSAIVGYGIAFLCDVVVAWALYVLLKPVDENLSLLTAWFRLVYTVIALVALLNLVTVSGLLSATNSLAGSQSEQVQAQVMLLLMTFRSHWYFGLLFFGIHLGLLGYLVMRSNYIPKILGMLLIIAGLGYLLSNLKPFLFPNIRLAFAEYTFYGELIFMLWLLIKGPGIQESSLER
jgi:hypothetical protein